MKDSDIGLFLKCLAAVIVLSAAFAFGDEPPRPRLSPETLSALEGRVSSLESRVDALEGKTACPCPDGGKCICPPDACKCEDCPEHISNNRVIEIYAANEAEISKIWTALGDREDATMRRAVQIWLRQQLAKKQGLESTSDSKPGRTARRLPNPGIIFLGFTSDSCIHCPGAKRDCESLPVEWLDVDSTEARKYNVGPIPAVVVLRDGEKAGHFEGRSGLADFVRRELDGKPKHTIRDTRRTVPRTDPHDDDASDEQIRQHLVDAHGYSWSQVDRMNRSQLKTAHNRGHGGPAMVSRNYPVRRQTVRYAPPVNYAPPMPYVPQKYFPAPVFYGGCANGQCGR